jgi:HD-GYP domain-containing protein (c-di-GMP phosphodiesterase class II)
VLTEVAQRLRGIVRQGEWLARIGGEEFAWILPDTDGVAAYAAAERARQAIAGEPFGDAGAITLSAGVCGLDESDNADDLYRLADVALYWAKSHGRNMTFRYSAAVAGELGEVETPAEVERRQTVRTLHSLAAVVEAKDVASTGHTDRVASLVHRLATVAGWEPERAARLREAALLHDVGKVALRSEVLSKPARLTEEEYEHVKTHAAISARMVASVLDAEQTAWVRQHHERWDGRGYPDGLQASEISEGGALMAMADAFDAMTSPRAYKAAMSVEEALLEARAGCGTQFAPPAVGLLKTLLAAEALRQGAAPPPGTTGR